MYWANRPATSGPSPSPVRLATEATTAARRRSARGCGSASAAVTVPVANPAASPLNTRATISSPIEVADRKTVVLTAAAAIAMTSTLLRHWAPASERYAQPGRTAAITVVLRDATSALDKCIA
jgi:hypothetical protein